MHLYWILSLLWYFDIKVKMLNWLRYLCFTWSYGWLSDGRSLVEQVWFLDDWRLAFEHLGSGFLPMTLDSSFTCTHMATQSSFISQKLFVTWSETRWEKYYWYHQTGETQLEKFCVPHWVLFIKVLSAISRQLSSILIFSS